jgi:hypothetical protein
VCLTDDNLATPMKEGIHPDRLVHFKFCCTQAFTWCYLMHTSDMDVYKLLDTDAYRMLAPHKGNTFREKRLGGMMSRAASLTGGTLTKGGLLSTVHMEVLAIGLFRKCTAVLSNGKADSVEYTLTCIAMFQEVSRYKGAG